MTKNITKIDNSELFDSIQHFDDDGNEYWFVPARLDDGIEDDDE